MSPAAAPAAATGQCTASVPTDPQGRCSRLPWSSLRSLGPCARGVCGGGLRGAAASNSGEIGRGTALPQRPSPLRGPAPPASRGLPGLSQSCRDGGIGWASVPGYCAATHCGHPRCGGRCPPPAPKVTRRQQSESRYAAGSRSGSAFLQCLLLTPICIIFPSHSSSKLCAFERVQSRSSGCVAVLNRASLLNHLHLRLAHLKEVYPPPPKKNRFGPTEGQNEQWREANRCRQRQTI